MMDSIFFWFSKLIWFVISPDTLLVILVIASLILLQIGLHKQAKILLCVEVFFMIIISFFPVGEWLLYPLEIQFSTNPKLPQKIDGVIVLAGAENAFSSAIWQQAELSEAAERDLAFMRLVREYPDAKHVFTGGSGSLIGQQYKQAHVAMKLFREQGLDTSQIIFEELSRNTYENAKFTQAIVKPESDENWILITTAWHMPRSVGIFNKMGWSVIPYPVDHHTSPGSLFRINMSFSGNLRILKKAIKEWAGLTAYYFTGKTTSILPGERHST